VGLSNNAIKKITSTLKDIGYNGRVTDGLLQHLEKSGINSSNYKAFAKDIRARQASTGNYTSSFDKVYDFGKGENNFGYKVFHASGTRTKNTFKESTINKLRDTDEARQIIAERAANRPLAPQKELTKIEDKITALQKRAIARKDDLQSYRQKREARNKQAFASNEAKIEQMQQDYRQQLASRTRPSQDEINERRAQLEEKFGAVGSKKREGFVHRKNEDEGVRGRRKEGVNNLNSLSASDDVGDAVTGYFGGNYKTTSREEYAKVNRETRIATKREGLKGKVYGKRQQQMEDLSRLRQTIRNPDLSDEARAVAQEKRRNILTQVHDSKKRLREYDEHTKPTAVDNELDLGFDPRIKALRKKAEMGGLVGLKARRELNQTVEDASAQLRSYENNSPIASKTSGAQVSSGAQSSGSGAGSAHNAAVESASHDFSESAQGKMAKLRGAVGGDNAVEHYMKTADKLHSEMQALKGKEGYDTANEIYKNHLESGPGMGDYIYGNGLHYKAAGIAIGGGILATAMGDGRRSNAQLYSSPF